MMCPVCHGQGRTLFEPVCPSCCGSGVLYCCEGASYGEEMGAESSQEHGEAGDSGKLAPGVRRAGRQEDTRGQNGRSEK